MWRCGIAVGLLIGMALIRELTMDDHGKDIIGRNRGRLLALITGLPIIVFALYAILALVSVLPSNPWLFATIICVMPPVLGLSIALLNRRKRKSQPKRKPKPDAWTSGKRKNEWPDQ